MRGDDRYVVLVTLWPRIGIRCALKRELSARLQRLSVARARVPGAWPDEDYSTIA
jgi:hypothetical protein